ncbi:hypothetical protein EJ08DRAFT_149777 [Tothia fuscella]|uniref:CCHC-type domain-containing protein n=1 Tax=Tothia fuscella TaxID=1048955 RepID=A0A9P4U4Y2_9PEZI|nr:hypothetical protein EJ08DRAFT_149777 [Tothia fuscella]
MADAAAYSLITDIQHHANHDTNSAVRGQLSLPAHRPSSVDDPTKMELRGKRFARDAGETETDVNHDTPMGNTLDETSSAAGKKRKYDETLYTEDTSRLSPSELNLQTSNPAKKAKTDTVGATESAPVCSFCSIDGHEVRQCPEVICQFCCRKGHTEPDCLTAQAANTCERCQRKGHWHWCCRNVNKEGECLACGLPGHAACDCFKSFCEKCFRKGHEKENCPLDQFQKSSMPSNGQQLGKHGSMIP